MRVAAVTLEFGAHGRDSQHVYARGSQETAQPCLTSQCPAAFGLLGSISARGMNGLPDALGCDWQPDMLDAELSERVDDGVRDRGQS
jgi:hypothetical protein